MYQEIGLHATACEELILQSYRAPRSVLPPCTQCGVPNRQYSFYETCYLCRLMGGAE